MVYEQIVSAIVGLALLFAYTQERPALNDKDQGNLSAMLKTVFLFAGILYLGFSFVIDSTVINEMIYAGGTLFFGVFIIWAYQLTKGVLWG